MSERSRGPPFREAASPRPGLDVGTIVAGHEGKKMLEMDPSERFRRLRRSSRRTGSSMAVAIERISIARVELSRMPMARADERVGGSRKTMRTAGPPDVSAQ